jgi:hypothetical protein|tara:strand:+ start:868 stop:1128 length:261 start_codon:yes stop_codon:yes gene_type:complete
MKILSIFICVFALLQTSIKAEEKINCSKLEKLGDRISCRGKLLTSGIKKTGSNLLPEKIKEKKIKIGMPKSISEKKTLADFFKKKD